jgi:zinc transporter 11
MIEGNAPILNALLGTLLTWGLTAAGAALVFLLPKGEHRNFMDLSLGFAAGVMVAASYWSLLAPSIEKAEKLQYEWTWFPAAAGFMLGGAGICLAERFLPNDKELFSSLHGDDLKTIKASGGKQLKTQKRKAAKKAKARQTSFSDKILSDEQRSYKRILLLVIAITVHNFPEGLAVGVGFGAVGTGDMSFREARSLAWGIGLQNFPEGLAVSLPLYRQGMSAMKSFWFGQLSGMVEPIAGVLGAVLIQYANPVLPYALSFAAGAMIYVVVDDLIPEASESKNTVWSTWGCMIGFTVMMIMDVALG